MRNGLCAPKPSAEIENHCEESSIKKSENYTFLRYCQVWSPSAVGQRLMTFRWSSPVQGKRGNFSLHLFCVNPRERKIGRRTEEGKNGPRSFFSPASQVRQNNNVSSQAGPRRRLEKHRRGRIPRRTSTQHTGEKWSWSGGKNNGKNWTRIKTYIQINLIPPTCVWSGWCAWGNVWMGRIGRGREPGKTEGANDCVFEDVVKNTVFGGPQNVDWKIGQRWCC